jgi:D-alanine-D-alanine ligase
VFNIAEGVGGRCREAQVPALLELYGIPYTMSDPLACAATLDKAVAKRLVREAGLLTPRFVVVETPADVAGVRLCPPLFAKPLAEGTGMGIDERSRIANRAELRAVCERLLERFRKPVLVEEYLPGREFTTGLIGTGADARVIGTMEVRIRAEVGPVDYSYEMKEHCERWVDYATPELGPLRDAVERLALDAYRVLQCRDTARVDVRLDAQGRPSFMEINPLPGLHPTHSDLPMIATCAGWTYPKLIGAIVDSARRRYSLA